MPSKVKVGETVHGTRVFLLKLRDKKLLAEVSRAHNPLPRGRLRDHVLKLCGVPAVVVIQVEKRFVRILKLTEEQLLIPIQVSILPADCRKRLVELDVLADYSKQKWRQK